MTTRRSVTVLGAYGHTGRFVIDELTRRGWTPIAAGRDPARLAALAAPRGLEARVIAFDDPASLDAALAGALAVIHCAGPFARTADAAIDAALRARIPYLDIAAEVEVVASTFERHGARARAAGVPLLTGMAFYGGLGDLLATAAIGDWADRRDLDLGLAYALDSWRPTAGTRETIAVSRERRAGRRLVARQGRLELRDDPAPDSTWTFPPPLGAVPVLGDFTTADSVTISRHLPVREIRSYMTTAAITDLAAPDPSPPVAVDDRGRSAQTFMVDVVAWAGDRRRRATARGRDIYAISAPLVVEALRRVVDGPRLPAGVLAAGQAFAAADFLAALGDDLAVEITADPV